MNRLGATTRAILLEKYYKMRGKNHGSFLARNEFLACNIMYSRAFEERVPSRGSNSIDGILFFLADGLKKEPSSNHVPSSKNSEQGHAKRVSSRYQPSLPPALNSIDPSGWIPLNTSVEWSVTSHAYVLLCKRSGRKIVDFIIFSGTSIVRLSPV